MSASSSTLPFPTPKALLFDLMGTCLDWHSSLLPLLLAAPPLADPHLPKAPSPSASPDEDAMSALAVDWRLGFFEEIQRRYEAGLEQEDIDVTHRRVLDRLVTGKEEWDDEVRERLVGGWHVQRGWPDAFPALTRLREKFFLVVLANGTMRLQLDIIQSSNLPFHQLLSSELLGMTKPDPAMYERALQLIQIRPHECLMVAAHAYDLRAAKTVGMRTAYIHRATEDPHEDMEVVRGEVDVFVDGRRGDEQCGLGELADLLLGRPVSTAAWTG